MQGIVPLARDYDQWGFLAPAVDDAALLWSAVARVPLTPPGSPLRVGFPASLEATLPPVAPAVVSAFAQAMRRFARRDIETVALDLGPLGAWQAPRQALQMQMVLEIHRAAGWWPRHRERYTAEVRTNLETAEKRSAEGLVEARAVLGELDARIDASFGRVDIIAVPTVAVVAPTVEEIQRMPANGTPRHPAVNLLGQATRPFARADLASISVPAETAAGELPIGIQLVGRTEAAVFHAAYALEFRCD
jgi:aspartyl-tRNA(Asn)/glutamyl-tRNA(Gln) amidotransferase subunit A